MSRSKPAFWAPRAGAETPSWTGSACCCIRRSRPSRRGSGYARASPRRCATWCRGPGGRSDMSFVLGLTGSVGMGKSVTAAMFRAAACPSTIPTRRARLYGGAAVGRSNPPFPGGVVDGRVDRGRLGRAGLRRSDDAMKRLEAIVHPLVRDVRWRSWRTSADIHSWFSIFLSSSRPAESSSATPSRSFQRPACPARARDGAAGHVGATA